MHQNIERLVDQFIKQNREKIYILYLGDLDPQGWDMDRLIREDLARQTKGLKDKDGKPAGPRFVFKRIGVTEGSDQETETHASNTSGPNDFSKIKEKASRGSKVYTRI